MHTWVRRGLRTALVTGGLLMLGTGIASADENVNPDQPPSPVDAGASSSVNAGHVPLDGALYRNVGGAVERKAATPSLPAAGSPAPMVENRVNPLVRQAQPVARPVEGRGAGDTLSGVFTTAQMTSPTRTVGDTAAGLPRTNGTTGSQRTPTAGNNTVGRRGFAAQPESLALPAGVNGTGTSGLLPRLLSGVPRNGVLPGLPTLPLTGSAGLPGAPEAQSAPAPADALPDASTGASVSGSIGMAPSQLPATDDAGVPTPALPTGQVTQMLGDSPVDSLPGGLSAGDVVSGVAPWTQDEVLSPAVQAPDARSTELPPEAALPTQPTVGQAVDSASSASAKDVAGTPTALVQSLEDSPVPMPDDPPSLPTVPEIAPVAVLETLDGELSHVDVRPNQTVPATMGLAQGWSRSTIGTQPSVPRVPAVPNVSSAPAARSIANTVPMVQAAIAPFSAASTTAVPSPVAELEQHLGRPTFAALPGVPTVANGVDSLFSAPAVTRLAEAPTSARHDVDESALHTAESPFSSPDLPSPDQATYLLPPNVSTDAPAIVKETASQLPAARSAVQPVEDMSSTTYVSSTDQAVGSHVKSALIGMVPALAPMMPADSVPQVTGVPAQVPSGVNESPSGALPSAPKLPSAPPAANVVGSAVGVASSPRRVTNMAEAPVSNVNESSLPVSSVGPLSRMPGGQAFGVSTVRDAATRSVAAVPMEKMAQVPGTVSRSISESRASYLTASAPSAVHSTNVFGKPVTALPGVSDGDSIAGVLPMVPGVFPHI